MTTSLVALRKVFVRYVLACALGLILASLAKRHIGQIVEIPATTEDYPELTESPFHAGDLVWIRPAKAEISTGAAPAGATNAGTSGTRWLAVRRMTGVTLEKPSPALEQAVKAGAAEVLGTTESLVYCKQEHKWFRGI